MERFRPGWREIVVICFVSVVGGSGSCAKKDESSKGDPKEAGPAVVPKDRAALERLTWKHLREAPQLRKLAELIPSLSRALQRLPLSSMDEMTVTLLMENVCDRRLVWSGVTHGTRAWYRAVWQACGPRAKGLLSASDRVDRGALALWVVTLHGLLRRAGVRPSLARALSRAWLRPHPRLALARRGVPLPKTRALQSLGSQSILTVTKTRLYLDGKALDIHRQGDKLSPAGRLAQVLSKHRGKTAKKTRRARNHLALLAAAKTPYGLVRRLVASVAQAGYHRLHVLARGEGDEPGIIEVHTKSPLPSAAKSALGLGLELKPGGYLIRSRFGNECPEGVPAKAPLCIRAPGKLTAAASLRALSHRLWYLFGLKYKDPSSYASPKERHQLLVSAADSVSLGEILGALAALRTIPSDAKDPPVQKRIPLSGCRRQYQETKQTWRYPSVGGESLRDVACMYDLIVVK